MANWWATILFAVGFESLVALQKEKVRGSFGMVMSVGRQRVLSKIFCVE